MSRIAGPGDRLQTQPGLAATGFHGWVRCGLILLIAMLPVACGRAPMNVVITPGACVGGTAPPVFTTGGQYVDPGNGVVPDRWSMLVRWQGGFASLATDAAAGDLTGLRVPKPMAAYQRGTASAGTAGAYAAVQLHCDDAGMVLDTRAVPHVSVTGGGYNDMFGYAWSAARQPAVFAPVAGSVSPDTLELSARIAVPVFRGWVQTTNASGADPWSEVQDVRNWRGFGAGQVALFAYLRDARHPGLPPVAVLAGAFLNQIDPQRPCPANHFARLAWDYGAGDGGRAGVWYAGTAMCTTDVSVADPAGAATVTLPFADARLFRIRYPAAGIARLAARINRHECIGGHAESCGCGPATGCPAIGYSEDAADYRLEYAGVIGEVTLCREESGAPGGVSCDSGLDDRQVLLAARISGVVVTRIRPEP